MPDKGSIARGVAAAGVLAALGPGTLLPNAYDMLWRMGGCFVMLIGIFFVLSAARQRAREE
jgi:type IV secretory pathway VirB2 component (pilin)